MKWLVYGILPNGKTLSGPLPTGPDENPVLLLAEGDLATASSLVAGACAAPSVSQALAYARVVQALHQSGTVLPMRYGCLLESEEQVREMLRVRQAEYLAALDEVAGCMEMGLRTLLEETDPPAAEPSGRKAVLRSALVPRLSLRTRPGAAYLAARCSRYAEKDSWQHQAAARSDRFRRAFEGLFVKCEVEQSLAEKGRLLSLHFLVRRENGDRFQAAFHRLQAESREKVLLTGPWPPYHFAAYRLAPPCGNPFPGWETIPGRRAFQA